ncbi:hypothetical protein LE190_16000 [Massilia oculi]|uniref:Uncharacterized protein n=1 Tax=Massilia hydrophila TaxID=3044279 RepID=A0ABS7YCJ6_9BURK|nr:hypothetical protein [Massilia oculi]MCA1857416.1 hypothetical protein [Massilia oculi]
MNQTPPELLAPHKAALVAAARDAMRTIRQAGAAGARFEIPGAAPLCLIVIGEEAEIGKLLREPASEPMPGGRRAGDEPAPALTFDDIEPGADGPLVVDSNDLVMIRRWLKAAAEAGKPVTLSGQAAAALYYAMDTGKPMEPDRKEE